MKLQELIEDKEFSNEPLLWEVFNLNQQGISEQECFQILAKAALKGMKELRDIHLNHIQRCAYVNPVLIPKGNRLIP